MTARTRLRLETSICTVVTVESFDCLADECLELHVCRPIDFQITAERIAYLGFRSREPDVFAEDMCPCCAPKLLYAHAMVSRHRKYEIAFSHDLAGQEAGTMAREIEPMFETDKVGPCA